MENEFYMIQEEFFYEDQNISEDRPLDNLIFRSRKEAEDYLMNYINKNNFQLVEKTPESKFYQPDEKEIEEDEYRYLVEDDSFPEKYHDEGSTKWFHFEKLTLFK